MHYYYCGFLLRICTAHACIGVPDLLRDRVSEVTRLLLDLGPLVAAGWDSSC